MIDWQIETYNRDRVMTGRVDVWGFFDATLRHNKGGVWLLKLPADHPQSSLFSPGSRVVFRGGTVSFSGPVRGLSVTQSDGAESAVLEVTGIDDTGVLAERVIWPDPAHALDHQRVDAYTHAADAEAVLRQVVSLNAGPTALADRRVVGLVDSPSGSQGAPVTISERYTNLLEAMSTTAAAGGVGFRIIQKGHDLVMEVFVPLDKTKTIQWSPELGNLKSFKWSQAAPSVTRALVAGQGEGKHRTIKEARDVQPEQDWGVVAESFIDARDTDDVAELVTRGAETLKEASATAAMQAVPLSVPPMELGVDVWLGDRVTVAMSGIPNPDIISQVRIEVGVDGTRLTPTVGAVEVVEQDQRIFDLVRRIGARMNAIERRQ